MGAMVIFADMMMSLFASFVLILVLVMGLITTEYSKKVDLLSRQLKQEQTQAKTGTSDLILTVAMDKSYSFTGGGLPAAREVASLKEVTATLTKLHPARLRMRIDRSVPTGTTQSILEDCRDLGIQPLWSFKKQGG